MDTKFEDAVTFFSILFLGKHNIPDKSIKPYGAGWCVVIETFRPLIRILSPGWFFLLMKCVFAPAWGQAVPG